MKFKILIFTLSLFTISISLYAKPATDSVGVKNNDGKKIILFKVKAKDTYYAIGRRYHVKPAAIMEFNGSKKETLSLGTIIKVPTETPYKKSSEKIVKETKKEKKARLAREAAEAKAAKKHKHTSAEEYASDPVPQQPVPVHETQPPVQVVQQVQKDTTPPTQYKVSAGETLYAISKRFNTTVEDITKLNKLTSTALTPGQILLVRAGEQTPRQPVTALVKHDSMVLAPVMDSSNAERHLSPNRFGLYEKNEKGVATWIDDPSLDPNKKLVLHRTAPIGTVIKITNPMTNRTTFAKVVGRFTDNEATKDVIIVMTKNVADSLGALDKRFQVSISYGSPNE
ncbi:MAG TPA: LysM peptidoglycan-binding domain-containing protein [Mucilaginibacter sp.]|jgi:LysM repeat protein